MGNEDKFGPLGKKAIELVERAHQDVEIGTHLEDATSTLNHALSFIRTGKLSHKQTTGEIKEGQIR
ncbi:hypothetical protein ACFL0U_00835 [Pseudomonadota bacterium]